MDDSFDVRHSCPRFCLQISLRHTSLHKQSALHRKNPLKERFEAFYYTSMPSSTTYISTGINEAMLWRIRISDLLYQVGWVSKLSRISLWDQLRWYTSAPSIIGFYFFSQSHLRHRIRAAHDTKFENLYFPKYRNPTPSKIEFVPNIMSFCPSISHIYLEDLSPIFMHHNLSSPGGVHILVNAYAEAIRGQKIFWWMVWPVEKRYTKSYQQFWWGFGLNEPF